MLLLRLYNREVTFLFGYVTVNGNVYSSDSDAEEEEDADEPETFEETMDAASESEE